MADNPFEDKSEHNPFQDPSVQATGGARGDGFDSPFDPPAAAPAAPAAMPSASKPAAGAYDRAPAPTSTFGAYDTGAYGGGGGSAYSAPAASAYDVRALRTPDSAPPSPLRLLPNPDAHPSRRDGTPRSSAKNLGACRRRRHPEAASLLDPTPTSSRGSRAVADPLPPFPPRAQPPSASVDTSARARDLDERERALARREADLARREAALPDSSRPKNYPFPGVFVIAHHDIDGEIPEASRPPLKMTHYSFILLVVCLFYNFFFCASAAMFSVGAVTGWMMAAVYLLCGVPGAYYLWYRRLYSACKNDSALSYLWFFVVYLVHIAFCLYAFIGMTETKYSLAGVSNASQAMAESGAVGAIYAFGAALFGADLVLSVYALRMVYARFRGGGHTIQDARNEAVREGVRAGAANAV